MHPHTLYYVNNSSSGDGPYYDEFYTNFNPVKLDEFNKPMLK
jgi:hypothetical protein